ncbi:hypothetical protein [Providencia sneebia]|uniref:Uncharacterized protein n=1 Tax=Providencia sneebia DSM 19967 TaxID=1141660 RepID=K8WHM1_9GAMM|nr:hypothetical protein [Providencia sneebia]EKT60078.1 hypothetical protein OO7_04584 [Providencia sneebia DSM 19967]
MQIKQKNKRVDCIQNGEINIDPYEMLVRKLERMSWNGLSDPEFHLDKSSVITWFSQFRNYSDDFVKSVLVEGILNNEFHNILYVLSLVQSNDFREMTSMEAYTLLYQFVCNVPKSIEEWIDDSDLAMSQNVLALLSQSHKGNF